MRRKEDGFQFLYTFWTQGGGIIELLLRGLPTSPMGACGVAQTCEHEKE